MFIRAVTPVYKVAEHASWETYTAHVRAADKQNAPAFTLAVRALSESSARARFRKQGLDVLSLKREV